MYPLLAGVGSPIQLVPASEAELARHSQHKRSNESELGESQLDAAKPMLHALIVSEDFSLAGLLCAFGACPT